MCAALNGDEGERKRKWKRMNKYGKEKKREREMERKGAPSGSRTARERERARGRDPDPRQSAPTRPSSAPLPWNCVRAPCQLAEHGPRASGGFTDARKISENSEAVL